MLYIYICVCECSRTVVGGGWGIQRVMELSVSYVNVPVCN